jgi:hypothetical protein
MWRYFPRKSHVNRVGYGMRSGTRDVTNTEMKKSRRFMPYGDKDGSARTYKNIVPAPPKRDTPVVTPLAEQTKPRSPKRKRDEDIDPVEFVERSGKLRLRVSLIVRK